MNLTGRRQTENLHKGRVSAVGLVYFVTCVTAGRVPWLAHPTSAGAMLSVLQDWHAEGDGEILAATVMPDHVHVLFILGHRLALGRCVSRWKAEVRRVSGYAGAWQRDFWEHRLRQAERWEDYALYIFMNPYRAGISQQEATWPWWWAPRPERFGFMQMLDSGGTPPAEWIAWPPDRFEALATGEGDAT